MYRFEFTLNDEDYWEFSKYHANNAPSLKNLITAARLFLPAVLILLTVLSALSYKDLNSFISRIIFYAVSSVVWVFALKPFLLFFLKIQMKLLKKDGKLPYGQNSLVTFGEDFVVDISDETETKIKYTKIEKISVGSIAIYLYFSAAQALVIPFSVFENDAHKAEFLEFIKGKTNNPKSV